MYIFFSSSNTWSNVCVIYSCDIFMWYLQLWYQDICRHNIYKCFSKPTPDWEMWFRNDCGRRSIYKFNILSVIALWRKTCFCLPKKTKTYSPKDHLSNHQKFFLSIDHNLHVWSSIWSLIFTTYSTSTNITFHTQSSFNNINKAI